MMLSRSVSTENEKLEHTRDQTQRKSKDNHVELDPCSRVYHNLAKEFAEARSSSSTNVTVRPLNKNRKGMICIQPPNYKITQSVGNRNNAV